MSEDFLQTGAPKPLLVLNAALALLYFIVLALFFPMGNAILFALLIAGEIFHLWQVFTFLYTVWDTSDPPPPDTSYAPSVDVFIPVAGEPVELVAQTVAAARAMDYPDFKVFILNDGFVAKKENWAEMETLAQRLGVECITRTQPGGAKAGNINNALARTNGAIVAVLDADHVPHHDFLHKTAGYFADPNMGFVQTPQFYKNSGLNYVTLSSWEQQEIFFGPICKGKNRLNAVTMCGTNMLIRRSAFDTVGGMYTDSIAEDFITGLLIHRAGYRSLYVPEVLVEGLATEDLLTYSKQQFRWARGSLDVIFRFNPLFMRGITWAQAIQYLSSASFYLSGLVVLIDALLPLVFFYTGLVPVMVSGMLLAGIFLPYFFVTMYSIGRTSNFTFTFSSLCFSMGSFVIQLSALASVVLGRKAAFDVSEKRGQSGMFLSVVKWHLIYIVAVLGGMVMALVRDGLSASLVNNCAWAAFNIAVMTPFIWAAFPHAKSAASRASESSEPALAPQFQET